MQSLACGKLNSPEFKYVISWVVSKAICLWRRFSQEVFSSDACIAPRILDFQKKKSLAFSDAKFPTFSPPIHKEPLVFRRSFRLLMQIFLCLHHKSLGFSQDFPSSHAAFPIFFHSFGPVAPGILSLQDFPSSDAKFPHFFRFLALLHQTFWVFTGFPSSDATCPMFFHFFGPTAPGILGFLHRIFPHAWPYCTQKLLGFQEFPFSDAFTRFFLFWCKISHMRIQTNIPPWCQPNL